MNGVKRLFLIVFVFSISGTSFAQQPDSIQQQMPTAGQIFSSHYARVYQMGLRYNDYGMAKNALYNLYVENPQNDSILFSLSALYLQSGQYASSALTAKDVLQMKPKHTGAMEILGVSFENLGVKDKALDNYESLYLETDNYQTLYKIAFLQYELGRYKESKTNADILLAKKDAEELTVVYETADKQQKEYPIKVAIMNLKGLIAKAEGNKAEAKKYFEEALKLSPDFALAKENLESLENK